MKTLKALKITSILQLIYCFFCIASSVCFAIHRYWGIHLFFSIGIIVMYGWIINPIALISLVVRLGHLITERSDPDSRKLIGKKWIFIFIWPVITTVLYFVAGGLMVAFTGGV